MALRAKAEPEGQGRPWEPRWPWQAQKGKEGLVGLLSSQGLKGNIRRQAKLYRKGRARNGLECQDFCGQSSKNPYPYFRRSLNCEQYMFGGMQADSHAAFP
jgi:hypothetical protein